MSAITVLEEREDRRESISPFIGTSFKFTISKLKVYVFMPMRKKGGILLVSARNVVDAKAKAHKYHGLKYIGEVSSLQELLDLLPHKKDIWNFLCED